MSLLSRLKLAATNSLKVAAYSLFYDGAQIWSQDRTFIWPYSVDTKNTLDPWTRNTLLGLSRSLYANVGFVKGAIDDISRYSVGTGIFPASALENDADAQEHDDYFRAWSKSPELTGKFTFPHLCRIASRSVDIDGDIGFIFTNQGKVPKLQVVEAHRIAGSDPDKRLVDGVKLDAVNRAVAYRVLIGESLDDYIDIPASSFALLFDPDRCDHCRGASALKHAINHLRDKKDILAFEKLGVKNASAIANVITAPVGAVGSGFFSSQSTSGTGQSAITTEAIRGGAIPRLNPGETLTSFSSNRPSPAFTGFLSYIDRDVAIGLGVPLEFIWDSATLGGTSQRFVLEKSQRRFEERQEMFAPFILRVRNYVIATGIANGEIKPVAGWERVTMQKPCKITVDVGREAQANREDVRSGLRTVQEDYGERGINWKQARRNMSAAADDLVMRAVEMKKKHESEGMTLEMALKILDDRDFTAPPEPINEQTIPKKP